MELAVVVEAEVVLVVALVAVVVDAVADVVALHQEVEEEVSVVLQEEEDAVALHQEVEEVVVASKLKFKKSFSSQMQQHYYDRNHCNSAVLYQFRKMFCS